jgi:hypothetical protein
MRVLEEYVEVLNNFGLITQNFPDSVLEIIRNTNAFLYLANSYCAVNNLIILTFRLIIDEECCQRLGKELNDRRNHLGN